MASIACILDASRTFLVKSGCVFFIKPWNQFQPADPRETLFVWNATCLMSYDAKINEVFPLVSRGLAVALIDIRRR